ncbi:MAG: heavy-metal-associated domain-containing protein [Myxococcota bacterium]
MNEKIQTTLAVEGMTCPSCIRHIDAALKALGGVDQVEVKLREGEVSVVHAIGLTTAVLLDALAAAGYPARPSWAGRVGGPGDAP